VTSQFQFGRFRRELPLTGTRCCGQCCCLNWGTRMGWGGGGRGVSLGSDKMLKHGPYVPGTFLAAKAPTLSLTLFGHLWGLVGGGRISDAWQRRSAHGCMGDTGGLKEQADPDLLPMWNSGFGSAGGDSEGLRKRPTPPSLEGRLFMSR
jgi:hypothetical protein